MKALFKNVFIKPEEKAQQTQAGVYLPEDTLEKPQRGIVVSVGEEVTKIKVGDKVLYRKWGGNEFSEEGEDYLSVEETDILGLV